VAVKACFIDSQGNVHGEAFTREFEQIIILADGWYDILSKYNANWALVPKGWDLATALAKAGWQEAYHDDTAVILVRCE
jgi:hypothetical protein